MLCLPKKCYHFSLNTVVDWVLDCQFWGDKNQCFSLNKGVEVIVPINVIFLG